MIAFVGTLLLIVAGIVWQVMSRVKAMAACETNAPSAALPAGAMVSGTRYRPMLRLLSDEDLQFVPSRLRPAVRADRRMLFRRYLKCLSKDYGHLLSGIRSAMVRSGQERPELAHALAKNRLLFAIAVCRIEYRLALHTIGLGRVDVSGLVEALDTLRQQVAVFTPATMGAAT